MFKSLSNLAKSTISTANNLVKAVETISEVPVAAAEYAVAATKAKTAKEDKDKEEEVE